MIIILLAGGVGSRLKPLTDCTPKCLVPIAGKPLLEWWFELLRKSQADKTIYVNTYHLKDQVTAFVDDYKKKCDMRIKLFHETNLLGTAGTIREITSIHHKSDFEDGVFVAHADNLTIFNFDKFAEYHSSRKELTPITMMTFTTDNPSECGVIELENDSILKFMHEKVAFPPGSLANAAIYIFEKEIIEALHNDSTIYDISSELIPKWFGKISCWKNKIYHRDIGTPKSYELAQLEFSKTLFEKGI